MNSEDLTLKQIFEITEKLVDEQDEINDFGHHSLGKEFMESIVIDL